MAVDLGVIAAPAHTAVLTMEVQRGVCGDLAPMPYLTRAVEEVGLEASIARLLGGARRAGVRVVHCTFAIRPDGAGTRLELPMMAAAAADPTLLRQGSPSAELLPGLGPEPGDLIAERHSGMTPFMGTDLDSRLRAAGVSTVVATGVSANIGVLGLATEAVNLGFRVVVVRDAVAGVPASFGRDVIRHSLAYLDQIATVDDLLAAWAA